MPGTHTRFASFCHLIHTITTTVTGTGIKIYNDARRALRFVDAFGMDSKPETCEWVVQKYVEKPLLLGGRKFDMRVFALLGPDFK